MKTIWKFPMSRDVRQRVEMPKDAKILTVQIQDSVICLWAIVDVDDEKTGTEMRTFDIYDTGAPLPNVDELHNTRKYIGTIQKSPFVWHVFEIV